MNERNGRGVVGVVLVFLISPSISGARAAGVDAGVYDRFTSDHIEVSGLSAEYHSQLLDVTWPYHGEPESGYSLGVRALAEQVLADGAKMANLGGAQVLGSQKFGPQLQVSVEAGAKEVSDSQNNVDSVFVGLLDVQFMNGEDRTFTFEALHKSLVDDLSLLGSAPVDLSASSFSLQVQQYFWNQKIRVVASDKENLVSDGNRGNEGDLAAYFGSVDPQWLWIGYGVYSLTYVQSSSYYWSPSGFISHGPRAEVSYRLPGSWEKWMLIGGANFSWIHDTGYSGTGKLFSGGVMYGDRDNAYLKLSAMHIDSERLDALWSETDLQLDFHLAF